MSGGHFDYAYSQVLTFAEALESDLRGHNPTFEHGIKDPKVLARLDKLVRQAKDMTELMMAAEWLFSGDDGEETFMERCGKVDEK